MIEYSEINENNYEMLSKEAIKNPELQVMLIRYNFENGQDLPCAANMLFNYLFENPLENWVFVAEFLQDRTVEERQAIFTYFSENPDNFSKTATGFLYWLGLGVEMEIQEALECYKVAMPEFLETEEEVLNVIESFEMATVMMGLLYEKTEFQDLQEVSRLQHAVHFYKLAETNRFQLPNGYINSLEQRIRPIVDFVDDSFEAINQLDSPERIEATPEISSPRKALKRKFDEFTGTLRDLYDSSYEKDAEIMRLKQENQELLRTLGKFEDEAHERTTKMIRLEEELQQHQIDGQEKAAKILSLADELKGLKTDYQEYKRVMVQQNEAQFKKIAAQKVTIKELASQLSQTSSPKADRLLLLSEPLNKRVGNEEEKSSSHSSLEVRVPSNENVALNPVHLL